MPTHTKKRFGRDIKDFPPVLEFGDWGVTTPSTAFDVIEKAIAYFDSEVVIKKQKKRHDGIDAARNYYEGYMEKPLKTKAGEWDDNVLLNLCRPLIDDSVSWLFGYPEKGRIHFDLEKPAVTSQDDLEPGEALPLKGEESEDKISDKDEEILDMLQAIYEKSGGFQFFRRVGVRGGVSGHAFVKIVPAPESEQADGSLPKVVVLDPMLTSVMLDPTDAETVLAYNIEWVRKDKVGNSNRKEDFIYRQMAVSMDVLSVDTTIYDEATGEPIEGEKSKEKAWVVANLKAKKKSTKRKWVLEEIWAWNYAWSPIVDTPNLVPPWGYYGYSELEDIAGVNDSINFVASNVARIIKHHAHPKTIGVGMSAAEVVQSAIANFWTVSNKDAKINNLEMSGDMQSSFAMLDLLRTQFWAMGRGLDPTTYKDSVGTITNFGLRVLANRAIQKMEDKRSTYGTMFHELNRRLLALMGHEGVETIIVWPDPLPEDPKAELEIAEKEINLGIVSRQTIAEERGRSFDQEQPRIEKERLSRMNFLDFASVEFEKNAPADNTKDRAKNLEVTGNAKQKEKTEDDTK